MSESRDYYDGKYTVRRRDDGGLEFLRHGEPWPAADDLRFNNLVGVMFREQLEVDATIAALKDDLAEIAAIIESVDMRAAATDGPITPTLQEMTQEEISRIYAKAAKRGRRGK